jgi:hypothetical protein
MKMKPIHAGAVSKRKVVDARETKATAALAHPLV